MVTKESLLQGHHPSELDDLLKRMCPSYEDGSGGNLTSAYGAIHNAVQARIFVMLQLNLEKFLISGETAKNGYRLDGSAKIVINDKTAKINGETRSITLAVIEVKTGSIKPLQAAAYAYREKSPVLIAEVATGHIHLVDTKTAEILLDELVAHQGAKQDLDHQDRVLPGKFQCQNCLRMDCPHLIDSSRPKKSDIISTKAELFSNIPVVVDQLTNQLQMIAKERDFSVNVVDGASHQDPKWGGEGG